MADKVAVVVGVVGALAGFIVLCSLLIRDTPDPVDEAWETAAEALGPVDDCEDCDGEDVKLTDIEVRLQFAGMMLAHEQRMVNGFYWEPRDWNKVQSPPVIPGKES